jgi:molybdenum cofactor cytidylyltransferase
MCPSPATAPPFAAIILAAGLSSRYGGGSNKLLLPFRNSTVIGCVAQTVLCAALEYVVVVTGHERERVEAALSGLPLRFIHNPRYREGEMSSSIKAGLKDLEPTPAVGAFIVPGDQPLLPAWVFRRLREAFLNGCGSILTPCHGARRGHPVLLGRAWWPEVQALPDGVPVRALLRAHPQAVAYLLMNTDSVLLDVDTPEAYQRALAREGQEAGIARI